MHYTLSGRWSTGVGAGDNEIPCVFRKGQRSIGRPEEGLCLYVLGFLRLGLAIYELKIKGGRATELYICLPVSI